MSCDAQTHHHVLTRLVFFWLQQLRRNLTALPLRTSLSATTTKSVRVFDPAPNPGVFTADGMDQFAGSPWFSSALPLSSMGIRAWRMASAQASPSSPAATQYTSEAVATSKEWASLPGNWAAESWAGPRTCSTCDRLISCRRTEELHQLLPTISLPPPSQASFPTL